jgi:hypothetical protein
MESGRDRELEMESDEDRELERRAAEIDRKRTPQIICFSYINSH